MKKLFLLSFLIIAALGCKKKKDDPAPSSGKKFTGSPDYYFYGRIDGDTVAHLAYEDKTLNYILYSITQLNMDYTVYGSSVKSEDNDLNFLRIKFGSLEEGSDHSISELKSVFTTGSKHYLKDYNEPKDSVEVIWYDENGDAWSSLNENQTGTFTVTKVQEYEFAGFQELNIQGTFNCTLYKGASSKAARGNFSLSIPIF